ncbi:hypothetical protein PS2_000558 [Malus domestica]
MKNTHIAYQERTHKVSQEQEQVSTPREPEIDIQNETTLENMPQERILATTEEDQATNVHKQDTSPKNPKDEDHDPMGLSVLDNMEISMFHVLPVEFRPTTSQENFLDGDRVAKEALQVDYVATEKIEQARRINLEKFLLNFFPVLHLLISFEVVVCHIPY